MKKAGMVMVCAGVLLAAACGNEPDHSGGGATIPPDVKGKSTSLDEGKQLFQINCASCHNPLKDATGPALAGAVKNWANDTARMYAFVRNPQELLAKGDPHVIEMHKKYQAEMTPFPGLSKLQLDAIFNYVDNSLQP